MHLLDGMCSEKSASSTFSAMVDWTSSMASVVSLAALVDLLVDSAQTQLEDGYKRRSDLFDAQEEKLHDQYI